MIIGLTGGIASGKSTVSEILKEYGFFVCDADKISKEITQNGKQGAKAIEKTFGKEFFTDGSLNRKKLAELVFLNEESRKTLENILHPIIIDEIKKQLNSQKKPSFLDAPLLIESNLYTLCDKVIVVFCEKELRIKRAMLRDNTNIQDVINRINAQISDDERNKYADYIINNSFSQKDTRQQVEKILKKEGLI